MSAALSTIYCISGMGADERIFNNLELPHFNLQHIPWIVPKKVESLQEYAKRMSEPITEQSPIILGVSFGGIIAIEIAKQIKAKKIIIISSVKKKNELPVWMQIAGRWKLDSVFPVKPFRLINPILNKRLGVSNEEEKKLVNAYRKSTDPVYLNWAVHQVLSWKNETYPENLVHIHGDKDNIFPVKNIAANHVIKGGTHMMIYNRAKEIADYIEKIIQSPMHPHN